MRSEGFSFYIWGLGVDPCSRDPAFGVRNCPQPFATVRSRPQPSVCSRRGRKVAVPIGKVAKTCRFRCVTRCGHVVLRGRCGTSWHSIMFQDASKVVLCGRRNTVAIFSKDALHFSWQAQHFGHLWFILRGRRSTLDVSCCVFFGNRIVSAARSGGKVQIPWQAWHLVTCHENRRKPRTKRRFCSRSKRKLVGKRWFWGCDSDTSKTTRLRDLSHRHGNFSLTTVLHLTHVECHKVPCLPRKTTWRHLATRRKRHVRATFPIGTCVECHKAPRLPRKTTWRHLATRQNRHVCTTFPIGTATSASRGSRTSHTWNVTKRHACHAERHDHIFWHVEKDTLAQLFP